MRTRERENAQICWCCKKAAYVCVLCYYVCGLFARMKSVEDVSIAKNSESNKLGSVLLIGRATAVTWVSNNSAREQSVCQ